MRQPVWLGVLSVLMARLVLASCLINAVAIGVQAQSVQRSSPPTDKSAGVRPTSSELFSLFDLWAREHRLTSSERWSSDLSMYGFKQTSESGSAGTWERRDSTGLLRTTGFFTDGEISTWLFFFPSARVVMPDPVIAKLVSNADTTELQDDGSVEFGFPMTRLSVAGKTGRRREFMTLLGSIVSRRRVVIDWP